MVQEHQVYGITYKTPDVPAKSKIYSVKGVQKFRRIEIPDIFNDLEFDDDGSPVYNDEQVEFIKREFERIYDGYWFMNGENPTPTYITGTALLLPKLLDA